MRDFWKYLPYRLKPTIFSIGSFEIRWYGVMYIVAFFLVYILAIYRIRKEKLSYNKNIISDFIFWSILGVIIGGRLGYVLFYDLGYFVKNPLKIFLPFEFYRGSFYYTGIYGMSYHGGLIGVLIATLLFCRKFKVNFWEWVDFFSPLVPLGYTFGRIGNFINGELYGRATKVMWGMYFPLDPTHQLRHPSQLYEAFFEGIFLFIILWNLRNIKFFKGFIFSLYLIGYGVLRFFVEFFREPDPQIGFIFKFFTMGQILCILMVLGGFSIIIFRRKII